MVKKHELLIGLNDKDTKSPKVSTEDALHIVTSLTMKYFDGATIYRATGLFRHDDGQYVIEPSIKVEILVFDGVDNVETLIKEIKTALNQEYIAVQDSEVNSRLA